MLRRAQNATSDLWMLQPGYLRRFGLRRGLRWLLLGQMLSAAGRQEEAAVALREHLALDPGNEAVRRLLQQLEAGAGD